MVSQRRAGRWLPLALAALSLFIVPAHGVVADSPLAFANGQWNGSLAGAGTVEFNNSGVSTDFTSRWDGAFDFKVESGQVTTGTWSMIGEGIGHVDAGGEDTVSHADFNWAGEVEGDAAAPALEGEATMHMRTMGMNFNVTLSRAQTANPKLEIYTASCSHVTGDWTAGISDGIGSHGGDANITGPFAAYNFTDSLVDVDMFNSFMHDQAEFQQHIADGDVQHGELISLVVRAEALERLLRNAPECVVNAGFFSLMSYSIVRKLIDHAFAHPGDFSLDDLALITRIGVRAGVLGAGAPDQTYAQQTEQALKAAFDGRLSHAISDEDRTTVLAILELAVEMGWSDQVARASQWLAGG